MAAQTNGSEEINSKQAGRRRPRWLKRALVVLVVVVLLAIGLLAATPHLVPSLLTMQFETETGGEIEAQGVDLTWFSGQRIEHVRMWDPQGEQVADLSVEAPVKLINIVFGKRTIEPVRVSGAIDLKRGADGRLNIERVFSTGEKKPKPEPTPSPQPREPVKLPGAWGGTLDLSAVTIDYSDVSKPELGTVTLAMQTATINYTPRGGVEIDVNADVTPGGSVTITGKTTTFAGTDLLLRPAEVRLETQVRATDVPAGLIDSLTGANGLLSAFAGEMLQVNLDAQGGLGDADANASVTGPGLSSEANLTWRDGVIEAPQGTQLLRVQAALSNEVLSAMAPRQPLRLEGEASGMTLQVRNVALPYAVGQPLDLRAARGALVFDLEPVRLRTGAAALEEVAMRGLHAEVSTDALQEGVRLIANGDIAAGDADEGAVDVDLAVTDLLDAQGGLALAGTRAEGRAALRNVPTSILEPMLARLGLEPTRDIGPRLDVSLTANRQVAQADADTDLTLNVQSERLTAEVAAVLTGERVRSTGPATVRYGAPGALLEAYLPAEEEWRVARPGTLELTLSSFDLPTDFANAAETAKLSAEAMLSDLRLTQSDGPDLGVPSLRLGLSQTEQAKQQRLSLDGSIEAGGQRGDLSGALTVDDPMNAATAQGAWQDKVLAMRPSGEISLSDVDIRPLLAGAIGDLPVGDLIGGPLTLALRAEPRETALAVSTEVQSPGLSGSLTAELTGEAVATESATFTGSLPPDALTRLVAAAAPEQSAHAAETVAETAAGGEARKWSPRDLIFQDAVPVELTLQPWRLPLGGALTSAQPLRATLITPSAFRVAGLPAKMEPLSLARVRLDANVGFTENGMQPSATIAAALDRSASQQRLAFVEATLESLLDGAPEVEVTARNIDVSQWEAFLQREPGSLVGLLGPTGELTAAYQQADAGQRIRANLNLKRLQGELAGTLEENVFELAEPASLSVVVAPEVLSGALTALLTADDGESGPARQRDDGKPPVLSFDRATTATLNVNSLRFSVTEPLAPGALIADLTATANQVRGQTAQDEPFAYRDMRLNLATIEGQQATVGARAALTGYSLNQPQNAERPAIDVDLDVRDLLDPQAGLTLAQMQVTGRARVENLSMALVDSLADLNGVLQSALGANATAEVDLDNVSLQAGSVDARFNSDLGQLSASGTIIDSVMTLDEPLTASLRVSESFSNLVLRDLIPIYELRKSAEDEPASLRLTSFQFPLDGDLGKLSGQVRLDLGQATYVLREPFNALLAATDNDVQGDVRQVIPPIEMSITEGVVRYADLPVVVNRTRMLFTGRINLKTRNMRLDTEIPFGELDKGLLRGVGGIGDLRDVVPPDTMFPVVIKGTIGDPKLDIEAGLKELQDELGRGLLERGLEEALKELGGG